MTEKKFTIEELALVLDAQIIGDKNVVITGVNSLQSANNCEASFFANNRYLEALHATNAGVICIDKETPPVEGKNFLVTGGASFAFQKIAELFIDFQDTLTGFASIHPTAIIHPTAQIDKTATIGPYAVIDKKVIIGKNAFIGSHVYIGPETKIGEGCIIHPSVIIREKCILHNRVILQPGCVIGSCGFGYLMTKDHHFEKLQQIGNVVIEDDVEIGANTTIDRARFKQTLIQQGSKIDNLVQIAHNVKIGKNNAIAAQVGISGSTETEDNVIMGGQAGVAGHLKLGPNLMIAAKSGVSKSHKSGKIGGHPAINLFDNQRQLANLRKFDKYIMLIKKLIKKFNLFEE